jgi:Flavin containing amine oxidoreductase
MHTLARYKITQANAIKFTPPLPRRKRSAIRRLGYGLLNKLALEFPREFWAHALKRSPAAAAAAAGAAAAADDATGTYTGSGTALGKSFGHVGDKQGEFYLFTGTEPVCRTSNALSCTEIFLFVSTVFGVALCQALHLIN